MEEEQHKILSDFLTLHEIDKIPDEIRNRIENFFTQKLNEFITAKAVFEAGRQTLDLRMNSLSHDYQVQMDELKSSQEKLDLSKKYAFELQNQINESRRELGRLQECIKRLEKENGELREQKGFLSNENDSLHSQVQRKDSENERLKTEIVSLESQLQGAISLKCEALAEIEEVRSRDISLDFKEKHLEKERLLMIHQITGLEEELLKRTTDLQNTRSESSARTILIQNQLSQCEEDLQIANKSVTQIREGYAVLQRRTEELSQKLEDQRNHELAMHSSYREEVTAQSRLADLYKGMSDEANAKADDYSTAVKELQDLLEHATEQYGILETTHNQTIVVHDQEILDKQKQIYNLSKELDHLKDLLERTKEEKLNDAMEQLAPGAVVASKIFKKGLTLTQIYSQLVDVTNEFNLEKEENEKLKSQMEIILNELEEKAPILQQQRRDYESAINNVTALTSRLDELLNESSQLQEDADESKRLVNHFAKENNKFKSELGDLARQVCFLLKEVQESRTGKELPMVESTVVENNELASSKIINKTLVTFKDIENLQENNQKLLSIVRSLSSRQEKIEKSTDEINSGELKERLDRYIEQLSNMQAAQGRQSKMLEGLLKQRDLYRNMYQECVNQIYVTKISGDNQLLHSKKQNEEIADSVVIKSKQNGQNTKDAEKWYKEFQESEMRLNQVNNEFTTYKKERAAHERMLNDEIENLRKNAEKNSAHCCRLKVQLDSANERFALLQGNVVIYKSQIKILEEKCNNYSATIGKHEQSLMLLKDEALTANSRLSKAEVQLENLRHERQLLRDSEGRLLKEKEVLQRERHTHALLKADIEAIKASLERVQAEGQLRAEQRLDDATRESAALRRRLQEEQDRFRELSLHLERQIGTSQTLLKDEKVNAERIQSELEASRLAEQEYLKRIEELNKTLEQTSLQITSKSFTGVDNPSKKIKDLEVQLASHQAEIKSLSDQLKAARFQSQQYCEIAEGAEAQLRDNASEFRKTKIELENNLSQAQQEVTVLKSKIQQLEATFAKDIVCQQECDSETKKELAVAKSKIEELEELKNELRLMKKDLQEMSTSATAAEDKYAREMVLHSIDIQALTNLKEKTEADAKKIAELLKEKSATNENLLAEKSMWQEREKQLNVEIIELQKRMEDLDNQNILLHNHIQELSERVAIFQSQQSSDHSNNDKSFESLNRSLTEEDSKSVEQLLQVMKYLRREKDLAIAKHDVLKSENFRLKSKSEMVEKQFEEMKESLKCEREKNEIDLMTASKQAELLRKVETLNAITDSNRILREERDFLTDKIKNLVEKLNKLSEEVLPLREKCRDVEIKNDSLLQENVSLKNEAMRWRQRANTLVDRSNKASPEDWRRLQTERENLSKLLTSEREVYAKQFEELSDLSHEKTRLQDQLNLIQHQLRSQEEQNAGLIKKAEKLTNDLIDSKNNLDEKMKELISLKKELADKDNIIADLKNKEIQIRKIAKKYKSQYEELIRTIENEKTPIEGGCSKQVDKANVANQEEPLHSMVREKQLKDEGPSESQEINVRLNSKVEQLSQQLLIMQTESETLKKEIEIINKASHEKEERAKQVLKGARTKIMQLTEYKKLCEKEMQELKEKLDFNTNEFESNVSEYEARLAALKSQMDSRILRLEHERSDLQSEKEALSQRIALLQRQIASPNNAGSGLIEPPTANIKPMSARAETPLASIRPMSVVVQSRTAAVLPTTAGAPLLVVPQQPQQQLVHTTETSSPTSSHVDYQPASTSRQLLMQPQLSDSAESTQNEESEILESLSSQQQPQCQQLTVALVIPRIEQQQQAPIIEQQQTVPCSSTQSVSTSLASNSHKRPRTLDSSAPLGSSLNENADHTRLEQIPSPKTKRSRQQDLSIPVPASASDVEYQVPTSSQRDQDEEGEDGCIVVDCDEGEISHQPQEEEEFDNDHYEEEEEELPYGVELEGDSNEVEIIIEENPANAEIPRQILSAIAANQQQQSEAISSAGPTDEPLSFTARSSRTIAPMPRQQPQQHILLPQQYEDGGDDCIVPSTPTLYVPRRNDGFGEAINSPQVPQGRFVFGESSTSTASLSVQSHPASVTGARTMFGSTTSALAQVMQVGMDDTRIDLSQLEDDTTGRSVPSTPQQASPTTDQLSLVSNQSAGDLHIPTPPLVEMEMNVCINNETTTLPGCVDCVTDREVEKRKITIDSESASGGNDNVLEENRRSEIFTNPKSPIREEGVVDDEIEASQPSSEELAIINSKEECREAEASPSSNTRQRAMTASTATGSVGSTIRGATARRSTRTSFRLSRGARPTPIIWDNQSSTRGQSTARGHAVRSPINDSTRARSSRGRRLRSKYPYNY